MNSDFVKWRTSQPQAKEEKEKRNQTHNGVCVASFASTRIKIPKERRCDDGDVVRSIKDEQILLN